MAALIGRCPLFTSSSTANKPFGGVRRRPNLSFLPLGNVSPKEKVVNLISLQKNNVKVLPSRASSMVPRCQSTVPGQSGQMVKSNVKLAAGKRLPDSVIDALDYISNHNSQGMMRLVSSFAITLLFANASTMILPCKVLAEVCESDNSLFNMPLLFGIAMIGATVGGLLARQRKEELARLNDQLRQINAALRRQAKIESYAPNLSYAPVSRVPETEVIVDPRKEQLISKLRTGKNFLRNQDPERAYVEFRAAFELADSLGDHIEKKKAARGLGASLQRQGKYREAIKFHSKVLEIAQKAGEYSGSTEAYGAIADCYTELGDLEKAGKFYDKYIARLETD